MCAPDKLAALDALTRLGVLRFWKLGVRLIWDVERVYPRERGGTDASGSPLPPSKGLSPRARGNV